MLNHFDKWMNEWKARNMNGNQYIYKFSGKYSLIISSQQYEVGVWLALIGYCNGFEIIMLVWAVDIIKQRNCICTYLIVQFGTLHCLDGWVIENLNFILGSRESKKEIAYVHFQLYSVYPAWLIWWVDWKFEFYFWAVEN